ncbi:hypothetical protein HDV63DRAFT_412183 [Trichoderma sp. SZMC 28014]
MAQTASKVEKEPASIDDLENASQLNLAQLQLHLEAVSSPVADLTHNSCALGDTTNPSDLTSYQHWISTDDESYPIDETYNLSHWLPRNSPEALFFDDTQLAESPEKPYWTEPDFASDLLDSSLWSTASSPRDTIDDQLTTLYEKNEAMPTVSNKKESQDESVVDTDYKRRKRSASIDEQDAEMEKQKRLQRIIRSLERFENEQKKYGKRQLKAIKDGSA